jgi:dolichyl-phosphate beta-glucosyltransferase
MGIALSVVIPAFNEEDRVGPTLAAILDHLSSRALAAEIIVVDDGSRDDTKAKAAAALEGFSEAKVIALPRNRGKGAAIKTGILEARGDLILFTDADLSTPIEELDRFLPLAAAGADIVIGSRALPGADIRVRQRRVREGMGKIFNRLVRIFVLKGIPDTQCGFKLFRREAARTVFEETRTCGFCFDVEALALGRLRGLRIEQIPVAWRDSPPSRVRLIRSSAEMIVDLIRIRRRLRAISRRER